MQNTVKKHFKPEITPVDDMKFWKEYKMKNITVKMVVLIENFNLGYKMSLVLVRLL